MKKTWLVGRDITCAFKSVLTPEWVRFPSVGVGGAVDRCSLRVESSIYA